MNYIDLALSVLRDKISELEDELKYSHMFPEQQEEIMLDLQKLNRAVNDIHKNLKMNS